MLELNETESFLIKLCKLHARATLYGKFSQQRDLANVDIWAKLHFTAGQLSKLITVAVWATLRFQSLTLRVTFGQLPKLASVTLWAKLCFQSGQMSELATAPIEATLSYTTSKLPEFTTVAVRDILPFFQV